MSVRIATFDEYCEMTLSKLSSRLDYYATMTETGQITIQKYIECANGSKSIFAFETSIEFYNFLVKKQDPSVMVQNN